MSCDVSRLGHGSRSRLQARVRCLPCCNFHLRAQQPGVDCRQIKGVNEYNIWSSEFKKGLEGFWALWFSTRLQLFSSRTPGATSWHAVFLLLSGLGLSYIPGSWGFLICLPHLRSQYASCQQKNGPKKRQFPHGSPKNPMDLGGTKMARKRAQPTQGLQHTSFQKDQEGWARREMGQPRFFYSAHEWTCEAGILWRISLAKMAVICLQRHRNFGQASWVWNICKLSLISHLTHEFCWGSLGQMAIGTPAFLFQLHINSCTSMQEPPPKCHTKRSQQSFWMFSPVIFYSGRNEEIL